MPGTSSPKIRLWLKQAFKKGYNFESRFRLTLTSFKLYIRISLPRSQPTHNILRCQRAKPCASEQSKRNHRPEKKLRAEIIFHCCKWHRRWQQQKESRIKMELACLPCWFCQNILTTLCTQPASLFCYQKFRSFHLSSHVIEESQEE